VTATEQPTARELTPGRVVAISGPVIDAEFPLDALPQIDTAVEFDLELEGATRTVTAEVAQNADFLLTVERVEQWESQYGRLPSGAWLLVRTAWSKHQGREEFLGLRGGGSHSPGFQPSCSAFLAKERDILGVGVETADMLVREVLSRNLRDRRAVARYAGLTGSPDESGSKRREKGLAKAGNARVRRGLIQHAWRFLMFQKDSTLAQWFRVRTESARGTRKTMIVALARKLLIALWRLVREGVVPDGVVLRPA